MRITDTCFRGLYRLHGNSLSKWQLYKLYKHTHLPAHMCMSTNVHGHTLPHTHTQTYKLNRAAASNHYILLSVEIEKCFQIINVSAGSVWCHVPLTHKRHLNATNSPFLQHINLQFRDGISLYLPLWLPAHQSSPCPNWVSSPLLLGPYRITLSNWPALPHKTMRQELDKSY